MTKVKMKKMTVSVNRKTGEFEQAMEVHVEPACEDILEHGPVSIPALKSKQGSSWFWEIMKPGENGKELADRLPNLPAVDPARIVRWTKVTTGDIALAVVAVKEDTGIVPYSCILIKDKFLAGNPSRRLPDQLLTKAAPKKTVPKVKDKAIKFAKMKSPPAPPARKHRLAPEKSKWTQTVLDDFR